ncbi:hypothetical protein pdam_00002265 [Pocillopora damicornis]|uniref:Uncharacterized protein n=1 Tax=Pocillopora damicornis TaxID=46731 RepID=A0A3M6TFH5_POCDA|nr:hypothetical protein pdam_00002265 [Pocillopora damicornis]
MNKLIKSAVPHPYDDVLSDFPEILRSHFHCWVRTRGQGWYLGKDTENHKRVKEKRLGQSEASPQTYPQVSNNIIQPLTPRNRMAICSKSVSGDSKELPNKKFVKKVPAKHVNILETQEDIGWE